MAEAVSFLIHMQTMNIGLKAGILSNNFIGVESIVVEISLEASKDGN